MIPKRYLPLPWWRRFLVILMIFIRRVLFREGYWYLDLTPGGKLLCTRQIWNIFDEVPPVESWKMVDADHFRKNLATPEDHVHVERSEKIAKIFKSNVSLQFTIKSVTTRSIIPVQTSMQFDYDQNGRAFAMWGFAKILYPKAFGLCVTNIRANQLSRICEEQVVRNKQEDLLSRCTEQPYHA